MNPLTTRWPLARQTLAAFLSLLILMLIWFVVTPLLSAWASGEPTGTDLGAPAFTCCCWVVWLGTVIVPLSVAGEALWIRRRGWPWSVHLPVMTGAFFITPGLLTTLVPLALTGEGPVPAAASMVTLNYTVWGVSYWVIRPQLATLRFGSEPPTS
jgi:hypothetical protein